MNAQLATYEHGLQQLLEHTGRPAEECTLLLLGDECAGLERLALDMGIGRVERVEDTHRLLLYQGQRPDLVVGHELIDSVYCISDLLADLLALNPRMPMLFPMPNPRRRRVVRSLRRQQDAAEPRHAQLRREFIQKIYPDLSPATVERWVGDTRGLDYDDTMRAIDAESPNLLRDKHITCHPETGRWLHRLLPLDEYRQMLLPFSYRLHVEFGFPQRRPRRAEQVLLYMICQS